MKTLTSTRRPLGIALAGAVLTLLLASASAGVVTNTDDSGPGSLRQAIADAASGDTITFDASLSGQSIVLTSGQLTVDQDLVIDASGLAEGITIDGYYDFRIIEFAPGSSSLLAGLDLAFGYASGHGGGILNRGTLTLNDSTLRYNWADGSGGAICNSGTLTINRSILRGDGEEWFTSAKYGAGIFNSGTLTVKDSILIDNWAEVAGGGIYNSGKLTVVNSTLQSNSAWGGIWHGPWNELWGGGGICEDPLSSASTHAYRCVFLDNETWSAHGGAIVGGVASNCIFVGNYAGGFVWGYTWGYGWTNLVGGGGGGMAAGTAYNCIFTCNTAEVGGGGLYDGTAYNSIIVDNKTTGVRTPPHGWDPGGDLVGGFGGGMWFGSAYNCVFSSNNRGDWSSDRWWLGRSGTFQGSNIMTADPLFISPGCSGLKVGIFLDEAPIAMSPNVFHSAAPGFTVYYFTRSFGFTSPTWNGYPSVEIDQAAHPAAIWLLTHNLPYDTNLHQDLIGWRRSEMRADSIGR